jgi:hypothetical protein
VSRTESNIYYLNVDTIERILEFNHINHAIFADGLGYSRGYWSMIVNKHRPLSPTVRKCLTRHALLKGTPETDLWTRVPRSKSC